MAQTAINKPIYDAFLDAGASEGKAAAAARAILPSVEDAATKADVTLLKTDITLLRAGIERLEDSTKKGIERLEDSTKKGIERLENSTKKDIAELEVRLIWQLLGGIAVIQGLAFALLKLFS